MLKDNYFHNSEFLFFAVVWLQVFCHAMFCYRFFVLVRTGLSFSKRITFIILTITSWSQQLHLITVTWLLLTTAQFYKTIFFIAAKRFYTLHICNSFFIIWTSEYKVFFIPVEKLEPCKINIEASPKWITDFLKLYIIIRDNN